MKRPEYIKLNIRDIPQEIIDEYDLHDIVDTDGSIHIEAQRGMYGLPHAGLIANELLEKRLNQAGYFQSKYVPGLWSHKTRPISFTLVVNDFGVKYVGKDQSSKNTTINAALIGPVPGTSASHWTGTTPIAKSTFQHSKPSTAQHSPFQCKEINYGAKKQYAVHESASAAARFRFTKITGVAVDSQFHIAAGVHENVVFLRCEIIKELARLCQRIGCWCGGLRCNGADWHD